MKFEFELEGVWTHQERRGGRPCIDGTRVTAAQIIVQMAAGQSLEYQASNMDLPLDKLQEFVDSMEYSLGGFN